MIAIFLVFGPATLFLFWLYCRKVGSFVNAITILTGLKVLIEFVFEPIAYLLNLFIYDVRSMFLINLLSFCGYAALVAGLLMTKVVEADTAARPRANYLTMAWFLLAAAWAVYSPVLYEFSSLILEPRRIYELTRTGYGLYTFGSALLSSLAYVVFMLSSRRTALPFYLALLILILLKGSKGQFIILASVFVIAKVYLDGYRYSLTRSALYLMLTGVAGMYVFALNFRGQIDNIFVTVAEYSDYNRNGALVIQGNTFGYYRGQLSTEMLWLPKVPRSVWPNKPKSFGEFRLAEEYYPQWFLLDQGSPSFGVGIYFADFGWLAFLIYPLIQLICGRWLGASLNGLSTKRNAYYFVISTYLAGNNLLASGSGNYVVEHIVIGLGLMLLLAILDAVFGTSDQVMEAETTPPALAPAATV